MKQKILIGIIAIIGFITTIKLAIIYHDSNFNPYALSSFCTINDFVDCDGLAKTTASVFLGIPLAYWGMGFYLFVLMQLFINYIQQVPFLSFLKVFKRPMSYVSALGLISFLISIFLAVKSLFILNKICILCFFTYILNALIALIATDFANGGFKTTIKESFEDFIDGIKEYKSHFLIAVLIASVFLAFTGIFYPFTPHIKKLNSIKTYLKMKNNPYAVSGNYLGDINAPIKVELYSDYACPMCFAFNIMVHKAVEELGNIYVESHNLPLDNKCNKYVTKQVHRGACRLAKYALAAKNQGKYWDMSTLIFETNPKNDSEAEVLAERLGLDIEQFKSDIKSNKTINEMKTDIEFAKSNDVMGTPTLVINGNKYEGMMPYYELKKILKGSTN